MTRYALQRLTALFPILLLVSVIVFLVMRLLPGDPADIFAPPDAQFGVSMQVRERVHQELGLDQPLPVQYLAWDLRVIRGDLGNSLRYQRPALMLARERAPKTVMLVMLSTALACLIAVPVGFLAAMRQGTAFDWGATGLALVGHALPAFVLGPLLVLVFSVWLRWFPSLDSLVLPVVALGVSTAGLLVRHVRSGVLDELGKDYVRSARAKGLRPHVVQLHHVLPNALPVTIAVLATSIGYQLGGAVIVEQIFGWPGLGSLMFDAITGRDYAVVQTLALLATLVFSIVNLVADLARASIDPRLRDATWTEGR
jgi:peptide/nickel transport system permease protein